MYINSLPFFNIQFAENQSITNQKFIPYSPAFRVSFNLHISDRTSFLQTYELFYQFFNARPKITTVKANQNSFTTKSQNFNLTLTVTSKKNFDLFYKIFTIRTSSKFKLVSFKFFESGRLYINFNDFTTLYPFSIRFYDFYSWRNQVSLLNLSTHDGSLLGSTNIVVISFFYSFYAHLHKKW